MKLLAIALAIIAATKLLIASDDKRIELKKLVSELPVQADLIDPITKSVIIVDSLIELICAILIISLV